MNTTVAREATAPGTRNNISAPPVKLRKRIGSTVFTVNIHFGGANAETLEDKIFRLIEREVEKSA